MAQVWQADWLLNPFRALTHTIEVTQQLLPGPHSWTPLPLLTKSKHASSMGMDSNVRKKVSPLTSSQLPFCTMQNTGTYQLDVLVLNPT
jgi:hypothetical protein